jgi:omega-amidase
LKEIEIIMIKIGLAQIEPQWENRSATKKHIQTLFEKDITSASIDWVILTETTLSGFSMDSTTTILEEEDSDFFKNLACHYQVALTYGGVINNKNCCITLDANGNKISHYEKIHLFSYATENQHYTAGIKLTSFDFKGFKITPAICYDLRFANIFWHKGPQTDVFVVIANWPESRVEHWKTLLKARAIENQCFVIGVNRVGTDPNVTYVGSSCVFSPLGETLLAAPNKSGIFQVEISKTAVIETRQKFPFLKDRMDIKHIDNL